MGCADISVFMLPVWTRFGQPGCRCVAVHNPSGAGQPTDILRRRRLHHARCAVTRYRQVLPFRCWPPGVTAPAEVGGGESIIGRPSWCARKGSCWGGRRSRGAYSHQRNAESFDARQSAAAAAVDRTKPFHGGRLSGGTAVRQPLRVARMSSSKPLPES